MRILYMDCFLGFDASMLLGALIDAGANPQQIEGKLNDCGIKVTLTVKTTLRSSIECKKAVIRAENEESTTRAMQNELVKRVAAKYEPTDGTDAVTMLAVICAIELLDIEYILCSDVSLGEGTDGEVLMLLERAGIETLPSDGTSKNMETADAAFLTGITNESGPKPNMQILAIGYGAGGVNPDEPNIINAIIGEFGAEDLFGSAEREELIMSL